MPHSLVLFGCAHEAFALTFLQAGHTRQDFLQAVALRRSGASFGGWPNPYPSPVIDIPIMLLAEDTVEVPYRSHVAVVAAKPFRDGVRCHLRKLLGEVQNSVSPHCHVVSPLFPLCDFHDDGRDDDRRRFVFTGQPAPSRALVRAGDAGKMGRRLARPEQPCDRSELSTDNPVSALTQLSFDLAGLDGPLFRYSQHDALPRRTHDNDEL